MTIFDKDAGEYDKWYKTKLGDFVDRVETNCIFELFKIKKGKRILDVGCGTGNFSIKLARMGYQVTAIDISNNMLNIAMGKAKEEKLNINFLHMDVYGMEFEDNYFDGVLSVTAFEFFNKPKEAFEEMLRVLKPEGQLVIGTINKESEWGRMYLSREAKEDSVFRHASLKTLDDLKGLGADKLINVGETLFTPPYAIQEEINLENEKRLFEKGERGGFICALWQK